MSMLPGGSTACASNPFHPSHLLVCPFKLKGLNGQCKCPRDHVCTQTAVASKFLCLPCNNARLLSLTKDDEQMNLETGEMEKMEKEGVLNANGPAHHLADRNPQIRFKQHNDTAIYSAEEFYKMKGHGHRDHSTSSFGKNQKKRQKVKYDKKVEKDIKAAFDGGRENLQLKTVVEKGKRIVEDKVASGKSVANICTGSPESAFGYDCFDKANRSPTFYGESLKNREAVKNIQGQGARGHFFMVPLPKTPGMIPSGRSIRIEDLGDMSRKDSLLQEVVNKVILWVELVKVFEGTAAQCLVVENLLTNDESLVDDPRLMHTRHTGGTSDTSKGTKAVFITIYHDVLIKVKEGKLAFTPEVKSFADKMIKHLPWLKPKDEHWVSPVPSYEKDWYSDYLPDPSNLKDLSEEELLDYLAMVMEKEASIKDELKERKLAQGTDLRDGELDDDDESEEASP